MTKAQTGYRMLRELNLIPPKKRVTKTKAKAKAKVTKSQSKTPSHKVKCRCACARRLAVGKTGGLYYMSKSGRKVYCGKKLGVAGSRCAKSCPGAAM